MKSLRPYTIIGALAAAFILFTGAGYAKEFPEITAKELKARMDAGEKLTLINPLSEIEFNEKHIPGSVHIPLQEVLTTDKLPANKNQLIVTYCLGRKWVLSAKAASLVAQRHYTNIKVFRDGMPGWTQAGYALTSSSGSKGPAIAKPSPEPPKREPAGKFPEISAKALKAKMDSGVKVTLINPLSAIEFQEKHIPGSVHIPLQEILTTDKLPADKNQLIVTYCLGRKWVLSTKAASLVAKRHYKNVMVFRDGIPGWKKAGYSLKSSFGLKSSSVAKISPKQLNRMRNSVYIIDIRPEHAYANGYIPESRAIPLGLLSLFREEIPKDEKIVIIDVVGNQAPTACKYLSSEGFKDVSWVVGGFNAWAKQGYEVMK